MAYPSVSALFIDSNEIACIWSQQDLTETSVLHSKLHSKTVSM